MGIFNRRKGGDRRSGKDRRNAAGNYAGPERRRGMERRSGKDRRQDLAGYKGLTESQKRTAKRIVEALEYYDW